MRKKIIAAFMSFILSMSLSIPALADGPGGPPSSTASVTWSGATQITGAETYSDGTYTSASADQNAVLISHSSGTVTLNNPKVTKTGGTSASDNYSFYGINSAVMCKGGGTTTISGGSVTTNAAGANGIFSYGANNGTTNATGDGTTVNVSNMTIETTGNGSGGIMTTYGGTTVANNLTITTSGGSSAPIRTDRGGGWVTVTGGTYVSKGQGSPAIYSTADVKVSNATLTSYASEGTCIEGTGSIELTNCALTATNNTLNGNATFYDTVMIYQSMSGDASSGTSKFTMTGGSLKSNKGHTFHVTNTNCVINLNGVAISNSTDGVLISVCDDGWSGGSNVATMNATDQTLNGTMLVGSDSTLTVNLSGSSVFTGATSGNITNGKGSTVSTSIGTLNMTVGSGSKWVLSADSYVTSLTNNGTVDTNGHTLYVNGEATDGSGSTTDDSSNTSDSTTDDTANTSDTTTATTEATTNKTVKNGTKITTKDSKGNKIILTILSKNNKTVSYYLKKKKTSSITIPDTVSINGTTYKVTEIAANGMAKGKSVRSLTVGKYVKTIRKNALSGCKVKTIILNSGKLSKVEAGAFNNTKKNMIVTVKASKSKCKKIKKLLVNAGASSSVTVKSLN